jgi:hypothetical protein
LCFVEHSGFVKMSAQLRFDATLLIVMVPFLTWSLKWCHFKDKCLVLGFVPSL